MAVSVMSCVVAPQWQYSPKRSRQLIVCVGETLAEREAGQTEAVVKRQLAAVIDPRRGSLHQRTGGGL